MSHRRVVGATVGAVCVAVALSAAQEVREFDFVSVRRSPPVSATPTPGPSGSRAGLLVLPDGRFEARGQALANLTRVAFGFDDVDPKRGVVQAADWMWNDRFDITAAANRPWTTPPPGTTVPDELRTMLRTLLEKRFALQARIATKQVDVNVLRLAKSETLGPGLRPSEAQCRGPYTDASPDEAPPKPRCPFINTADRLQTEAVTMPEVARLISQNVFFRGMRYGALVDQTGLPGLYNLSLSLPARGYNYETIALELEWQLGLRLKSTRLPLPTLIIERAKKPRED